MLSEHFIGVLEEPKGECWPKYFVVTDSGFYRYGSEAFIKVPKLPLNTRPLLAPVECLGDEILAALTDGETSILILKNGWQIAFDLMLVVPGGGDSWPRVYFNTPVEALPFLNEFGEDLHDLPVKAE